MISSIIIISTTADNIRTRRKNEGFVLFCHELVQVNLESWATPLPSKPFSSGTFFDKFEAHLLEQNRNYFSHFCSISIKAALTRHQNRKNWSEHRGDAIRDRHVYIGQILFLIHSSCGGNVIFQICIQHNQWDQVIGTEFSCGRPTLKHRKSLPRSNNCCISYMKYFVLLSVYDLIWSAE